MPGDVHTSDTLEPGTVAGADPRSKVAGLRVDAQRTDGILASLEVFFFGKTSQPLGAHTKRRGVVLLCIAAAPLSFPQQPTNPAPEMGKGPRGLLLRLTTHPLECAAWC